MKRILLDRERPAQRNLRSASPSRICEIRSVSNSFNFNDKKSWPNCHSRSPKRSTVIVLSRIKF